MTGSDNPNILSKIKSDIINLLSQYGFTLHKWFSNNQAIIASHARSSLDLSKNQTVHTLGIQWNINEDSFVYSVQRHDNVEVFNKRRVLSVIAGIYDPLGPVSYTHLIVSNVLRCIPITGSRIIPDFSKLFKITTTVHLLCI